MRGFVISANVLLSARLSAVRWIEAKCPKRRHAREGGHPGKAALIRHSDRTDWIPAFRCTPSGMTRKGGCAPSGMTGEMD